MSMLLRRHYKVEQPKTVEKVVEEKVEDKKSKSKKAGDK